MKTEWGPLPPLSYAWVRPCDDAGSPLTLLAARKAYAFARAWVPFCRKYGVQCPCPDRFFAGNDDVQLVDGGHHHVELGDDRIRVKVRY